ncbi:MAG: dCTP deaminase [Nitrososphaerota archaeon]|nr:dCTP deaminase [Nitrososphaerota archaeon]
MILSDGKILEAMRAGRLKIDPFDASSVTPNGVDFHLGDEVAMIRPGGEYRAERTRVEGEVQAESDSLVLASTLEAISLGPDLVGLVNLRSTYARLGYSISPTVVDAGYSGRLTIQVRTPPYPVTMKKGERIWHLVFLDCHASSKPYGGRYQNMFGLMEGK